MGIILKYKETKEVEFNPAYPSFYKGDSNHLIAFYAENKAVKLYLGTGYYNISATDDTSTFYGTEDYIKGGEITEQEFNEQLAKALFMISGVEVVPTLALQD